MAVPPATLGYALSFVAGATDTAGFLGLSGLFTAHVTGNFVLIGATVAQGTLTGVGGKLLALPVFMLGVSLTRLAADALDRRGLPSLRLLLGAQAVMLAGFLAVAVALGPFPDADGLPALVAGMLGVLGMAVQNGLARLKLATLVPSTVMTGNVTQLVLDGLELARGQPAPEAGPRARRTALSILGFALGCAASAVAYAWAGFWCLVVPLVLTLAAIRLART